MTPLGIYSSTRVLMGQTDAVAYCQLVVNELLGEDLFHGLLGWLVDLLGYAPTFEALLAILDRVLTTCAARGLKLHVGKCEFWMREAEWCGRVVSSAGVAHSPSRIQGLCDLEAPATAADLQQLLCATNWMRTNIPNYAELVAPLRELLDVAAKLSGSSKKLKLARIRLAEAGWSQDHLACFDRVKAVLAKTVPLARPTEDKMVCLYTDASSGHWGAVATQVPLEDLDLPLAFLSGAFRGASSRWAIFEKEAFAVVEAVKRLDYLLLRPGGFRLLTDHRNLQYMFNPAGQGRSPMAKYQADKLQRWALVLSTFPYSIETLPGEANVWADLLSRWGAAAPDVALASQLLRVCALHRVAPTTKDGGFEWPTKEHVVELQRAALASLGSTEQDLGMCWSSELGYYVVKEGKSALSPTKAWLGIVGSRQRSSRWLPCSTGRRWTKTWTCSLAPACTAWWWTAKWYRDRSARRSMRTSRMSSFLLTGSRCLKPRTAGARSSSCLTT